MSAAAHRSAAIVTVGTELVSGISIDTNTSEIGIALARAALDVREAVSVPDDEAVLASTLRRLVREVDVVVVTGGLGPTHDDVTRTAASAALGLRLVRDDSLVERLDEWAGRHGEQRARDQVYVQADVLEGAEVLEPVSGTAPGQVVQTSRGMLVLLPGPPHEMRPMLEHVSAMLAGDAAPPAVLRCVGMTESDVAVKVLELLRGREDIAFTVLAKPGEVRAVLYDRGVGAEGLSRVAAEAAERIGEACYSIDGSSLPEVVLSLARERGERLAVAESCTGGLIAAALTDIPGASDVFVGGVVAYANEAKRAVLGVDGEELATSGAVSASVAREMATGARTALGADRCVSVTGVAGPGGGTVQKPVGTVWFSVASRGGAMAVSRHFPGDREGIRLRATAFALDLLRRSMLER